MIVDANESFVCIHSQPHLLQTPALSVGFASNRDQYLVEGPGLHITASIFPSKFYLTLLDFGTLSQTIDMGGHTILAQPGRQGSTQLIIEDCQHLVEAFDDCHLRTESSQSDAEFESNVATTYDRHLFR